MLTKIFFILTCLCAIVGAYLGYENLEKTKTKTIRIAELDTQNKRATNTLNENREKLAGLKEDIQEQVRLIADTQSQIDSAKSKEGLLKKDLANLEAELLTIEEEIEGFKEVQRKLEIALREAGVTGGSDGIPTMIDDLKGKIQEKQDNLDELELIINKLNEEIAQRSSTRDSLNQRLAEIKSNIGYNATTATITSVNTKWGFVVINRGSTNSTISRGDELLVNRGGKFVGKLEAKTLEASQTICDLDLEGFRGGSLPRPGDRVILRETLKR